MSGKDFIDGCDEEDYENFVQGGSTVHFPFEKWKHISDGGIDFVGSLLSASCHRRPTAVEALDDPVSTMMNMNPLRSNFNFLVVITTKTTIAHWHVAAPVPSKAGS